MNNNVGKGAVILTLSGLVCKLFGGLFRLPLTNIIGLRGIAVFQMVMTIYSFSLVCVSGGVTNALSKLVSSARARGDYKTIGAYFKHACIFSLTASSVFAAVFLLFSPFIAEFAGVSEGTNSYRMLALLLPFGAFVGTARGILQGYGNMTPTAISQIIEQVVKFAFGLIFAYILKDQGAAGGVFGAILGITVSEIFACLYLGLKLKKQDCLYFADGHRREFYKASLPLTFGGVILPLTHALESVFIVKLLVVSGLSETSAAAIYGVQTGVVGAILNFPLIISIALSAALLPNLSYLVEKGDRNQQKEVITKSMHTMWYLLIPLVVGLMAVAEKLYPLIYPHAIEGYLDVAIQLTYVGGVAIVCSAIQQQLVSILLANGHFRDSLIFNALGGMVKIAILAIVAITPEVSVFAISISNVALAAIVSICVIIKLRGLIALSLFELSLPLLASGVMFMAVKILLTFLPTVYGLCLAVVLAAAIYFVLTFPLTSKYFNVILKGLKKQRQ
ncbi:MAG: oligosaccharide flippase family protein [Clostridia bacterium]|nr:oligosaccharide flippase family protein [Clostridia bacterium]